jgi:hypothetical protein
MFTANVLGKLNAPPPLNWSILRLTIICWRITDVAFIRHGIISLFIVLAWGPGWLMLWTLSFYHP